MRSSDSSSPHSTTFRVDVETDKAAVFPDNQPSLWDEASPPERDAMKMLVATALHHMADHVDEWISGADITTSHKRLWLVISWENGALHEEVLRQGAQAETDRAERVADLLRLTQTTSE